ncbi:HTH-type transcriptional repressor YcgE [Tsuneonella dongtanensis]|uniref:HTH-type transcriptional repressor YcgE n=1 Tax=Tsuneonella dongtanensis TaxID=692370 RepID=A0A1B2AE65_9SPHN|nr:MerR family transcriptional regulator [Tsuneonella dongtanensis]ANY20335.1 HTH-type transcriptional repressor YcgE [Tsuneonella dongtanensis]
MVASFDDGKDEGALRTIGEVGDALGIKSHVLRYWEGQFPMLQPLKRSGGRRYYRPEDVALLEEIDRLVNKEGYTLRGAKAALKGFKPDTGSGVEVPRTEPQSETQSLPRAETSGIPGEAVDRLKAIRRTLAAALES